MHALRPNGTELPGWPVQTARLPLHLGERAYHAIDGVGAEHGAAVIGALAAGDLFGDGRLEVVADDNQGNVYAWNQTGHVVFHQHSDPRFSGAPLQPFHTVRQGVRDRTERGFVGSPVLASLDGHGLDVIVAGEDRHVYAWHANGRPVAGFPVLVADPDKVAAVDPRTHHVTFRRRRPETRALRGSGQDHRHPGGGAARRLGAPGDHRRHERGVRRGHRRRGRRQHQPVELAAHLAVRQSRRRCRSPTAASTRFGPTAALHGQSPFLPGWPVKIGIIDAGLLARRRRGHQRLARRRAAALPVRRHGYEDRRDAGRRPGLHPQPGRELVLRRRPPGATTRSGPTSASGPNRYDTPTYAAVGYPAFGTLDGHTISFFAPATGLLPGARRRRAGVPGRPGLPRRVEPRAADRAVPPRLPGAGQRSAVPHRARPSARSPRVGAGGRRGDLVAGPRGVRRRRDAGERWLAEADRRLDRHDARRSAPSARSTRPAGARKDVVSITRSGVLSVYRTLSHGVLAEFLAAVPPRQRKLR